MSSTGRRQRVSPSLIKSETFLFSILLVGLAAYVLNGFRNGESLPKRYPSASTPPIGVAAPDVLGLPQPAGPQASVAAGERPPAPITYLTPYILSLLRGLFSAAARLPFLLYAVLRTAVFRPLGYPLAFILAVIRPFTLLLEVVYDLFLKTPIAILSWFVREAIYPIYIFTGIAVLIGGTVGYSASHVPRVAIFAMEQVRSRVAYQGVRFGSEITTPASRYVAFDRTDDGNESDATEVPLRRRRTRLGEVY